ncbi:MAG: ABC transporter substrate-binding protein [Alphaproteobacteria bacterium]|nr:ABC transporter substrate-binding protein [Alphaproteobacteria bacterium]MCB9792662.1 ABC transporter substrate-binding protein [Alphaproteobacteria bacterium]
MIDVVDGRGLPLRLSAPPRRVVSLVPSSTETLFALGAPVVGCTRYCVHPREAVRELVRVGGTKDLVLERIEALAPELIVGNAEENTREMFAALEPRWPLYVSFPKDVDGAIADLRSLGVAVGRPEAAEREARRIEQARARLAARPRRPFTYAYLIWRGPWMAAGPDTFISAMLAERGGVNAVQGPSRYPELSPEALREVDRVLLSSEPFPFRERHVEELVKAGVPRERVRFVDGELCSWHGVRMAEAFEAWAAEVDDHT